MANSWSKFWNVVHSLFLYALATYSFIYALLNAFDNNNWQTIAVLLAFSCVCLFLANLSSIESFVLGPSGVTFKRMAEKAKQDIDALLRETAETFSALALSQAKMTGRFGGFSRSEQLQLEAKLKGLLNKVESADADIEKIWVEHCYPVEEFDYAMAALGGSQIPQSISKEGQKEWQALRKGGIKGRPTPDEIEAFWQRHQALTPERAEEIQDYRYYLKNRTHRRPASWLGQE